MSHASLAIRNAHIVDGTGAPAVKGDVAVERDKIIAFGKFEGTAAREIDAHGHVLSPGFKRSHSLRSAALLGSPRDAEPRGAARAKALTCSVNRCRAASTSRRGAPLHPPCAWNPERHRQRRGGARIRCLNCRARRHDRLKILPRYNRGRPHSSLGPRPFRSAPESPRAVPTPAALFRPNKPSCGALRTERTSPRVQPLGLCCLTVR